MLEGYRGGVGSIEEALMGAPGGAFATFCRKARQRHVVPWTLAYLAGAWISLEATAYLTTEYRWPPVIVPLLTIALAFGILFTVTIAWCHGEAGWQQLTRRELGVYVVLVVAMAAAFWVGVPRTMEGAAEAKDEAAPTSPVTRVSVLHLRDHRLHPGPSDLAADLTEALTHQLAQVLALQVVPLQEAAPIRGSAVPLDAVSTQLRAGAVVEWSMTQLTDSVRLTVQLIETESGEHLGSWVFESPAEPVSRLIRETTADISRVIRRRLGERVRELDVEAATSSPVALDRYRQARNILLHEATQTAGLDWRSGLALLAQADSLLAEAEVADTGWADPILLRAEAADMRSRLPGGAGTRNLHALREAVDHATRAMAPGRTSARALELRARLLFDLARNSPADRAMDLYRQSEADMRTAVRVDPDRPGPWIELSRLETRRGNFKAGYEYAVLAYAADSFGEHTLTILGRLASGARSLGRLDEAMRWCDRARADAPGRQTPYQHRLLTLASLPEPGPADIAWGWALADSLAERGFTARHNEWLGYGHMLVAIMLAGAGQADSAQAVLRRARPPMIAGSHQMQAAAAMYEAYTRLRLGQREETLTLLEEYARQLPAEADALAYHPWFRELRRDTAFQRICCAFGERAPAF
jgi:TolB-like protein/tetratricopeptide (TPR) repeat protein